MDCKKQHVSFESSYFVNSNLQSGIIANYKRIQLKGKYVWGSSSIIIKKGKRVTYCAIRSIDITLYNQKGYHCYLTL